jgi:acyl carrier protein
VQPTGDVAYPDETQEAGLPDAETTVPAETIIRDTIRTLLDQRGASGIEIRPESKLTADLGLDSLELAELSAVLEDEIGHDPFSEGIVPETVSELVDYYNR